MKIVQFQVVPSKGERPEMLFYLDDKGELRRRWEWIGDEPHEEIFEPESCKWIDCS